MSDQLIFRFLWVIELLDYTLIMFIVPTVGGILLLYPDTRLILLFLVCMGLSYALMTLIVSASKLLISRYATARIVAAFFKMALYLALLASWRLVERDLAFIHEFTSNWKNQAAFFGIASVVLISLYRTGILLVRNVRAIP